MAREWSKYQKAVFEFVENSRDSAVINAVAGSGKCLGRDECVLMFDGSYKKVQDVVVGDLLMGDESTPRRVLSTTAGYGPLKEVVPVKGEPFVCNDVHVLTFDYYDHGLYSRVDASIPEIESTKKYSLKHTNGTYRSIKLVRTGVEFPDTYTEYDSWLYGIWLGDGSVGQSHISNPDEEIVSRIQEVLPEGHYADVKVYDERCPRIDILCDSHKKGDNLLRQFFVSSSDDKGKFIKKEYLVTSREKRLQLLAGLIDSDGYLSETGYLNITSKWYRLAKQITFLCRSLGLAAYIKAAKKRPSKDSPYSTYYSISISGDLDIIPTVVKRKQAKKREQIKNVLRTGFYIRDIGEGEYFGFTLDGNGRFLLSDFTITHNTSTIVEASKIAVKHGSVLFLAFNKSIAQELAIKMEGTGVECKTLHSHGFRAIQKKLGYKCRLDDKKWENYITDKAQLYINPDDFDSDVEVGSYIRECVQLLNLARINFIRRDDTGMMTQLSELAEHHNFDVDETQLRIVNDTLGLVYQLTDVIDFTDMITLPLKKSLQKYLPKYDTVFVDEAQDLSKAQRELMLASIKPGGRFIAVGDKMQCINGFAGSDVESFNNLIQIAGHEFPLSVCYRCGKKIIEEAQTIVPYIEAFENQLDGKVETVKDLKLVRAGDMMICRKSAPLVSVCLHLIANGVSAQVKGTDIAEGLKAMVKRTKSKKVETMLGKLQKELDKVVKKLKKQGVKSNDIQYNNLYISVQDKIACIEAVSENLTTVDEVMDRLNTLFSDTRNGNAVTLSTVHKAKGLEADNVFILLPEFLPFLRKDQQQWEIEQEYNLKYVAITRAKKNLYYVNLSQKDLYKAEVN